jgi:hypothetical protein
LDPQAIQQALANAVKTLDGLKQALPTLLDSINPPTFAVVEYEIDYNQTFGVGSGALSAPLFSAGIFTSRGDTPTGQALLARYLAVDGNTSIKWALELDRTLGGACKTLIVERVRGAGRLYTIGGADYLGATLDVRVWA